MSLEEVGIGMGPSDVGERLERFAVLCIVQDGRLCVLPVSAAWALCKARVGGEVGGQSALSGMRAIESGWLVKVD